MNAEGELDFFGGGGVCSAAAVRGKTMLMKCICGFIRPTARRIMVGGNQVGRDADFPPDLGLLIETPGFVP